MPTSKDEMRHFLHRYELSWGKLEDSMAARIARMFTTHPETVGETYLGHMAFAAWFSSRLFLAGGAALLHAVFPFLCETTASRIVRELAERTHNRASQH